MGKYTVKATSKSSSKVCFGYILDTIRVDSITLFGIVTKKDLVKMKTFDLSLEFAMTLVLPYIRQRSMSGLQNDIKFKINLILQNFKLLSALEVRPSSSQSPSESAIIHDRVSMTKRICHLCLKEIRGDGYKAKRNKLSQLDQQCQHCGEAVCKRHKISICKNHGIN